MEKTTFNKGGQWTLEKYEMVDSQERNPNFRMANWPIALNENPLFLAETGNLQYEKPAAKPKKVVVGDKEMWHHVIKRTDSNRVRHMLSESPDPTVDGVSQLQGHEKWNEDHGHHLALNGKYTQPKHEGKGYMSALFRSAIDYHGALKGDDSYTPQGEGHSLKLGSNLAQDPNYTFHPGIKGTTKDKVVGRGKNKVTTPHNMWYKRADHEVAKKDPLGLVKPATYGWE